MGTAQERLARLRSFNDQVRRTDPRLSEESFGISPGAVPEAMAVPSTPEQAVVYESIIMRRQRPVLAIKENSVELLFADEFDEQIWRARLEAARSHLDQAIRAVGRIELTGGRLDWVGTGWLVHDDILVTNRHVANEFVKRRGDEFTFRLGDQGEVSAHVDFLQEIDNSNALVFKLLKPLHIEAAPGPDIAFFAIEPIAGSERLAQHLVLAARPVVTENVATIGYPAYDSRIPELDLMEQIYGSVYNKKRLAPGGVTKVEANQILHNCTTLGGNSGSVVVDLDSGKALGLHYSGSFLATNYAVRSDVVADLLARTRAGRPLRERSRPCGPSQSLVLRAAASDAAASVTIPLMITVSLGSPTGDCATAVRRSSPAIAPADPFDDLEGEEGPAEDYGDRLGYQPDFLGVQVGLPVVERDAADLLSLDWHGRTETELRYEHFSVVMNRRRRMCFFSAVNIDGNLSRKSKRVGWRWDSRVPRSMQIMNECYGSPPRFSRGHMTRREDPAWGETEAVRRGNADSMHVTNVVPQMQAFNSPIWLALEDYALQHAREDAMNISVFTGPYFSGRDPIMYGVPIPLAFWKIIVFIHDDTGELCATGYEMDQEGSLLLEEEFVFGAFTSPQLGKSTQVPIRAIAARSGISFGTLSAADPLDSADEAVTAHDAGQALSALEEIRFVT